ncbi:succinoglycan biosynthesis glycosyltransferase ExoM [Mucilaginibacter koreensis]
MDQSNNTIPVKISLCIATCRRVPYLTILLDRLSEINLPEYITLKIVIVDNDAEKSAETYVTGRAVSYRFPLLYGSEKQRGIPFTRNKAVSLVDKDTDFVAFIDDDEYPDKDWIVKLYEIQQKANADLVIGPSYPEFVDTPPDWVVKGEFFLFSYFKQKTGDEHPAGSVVTNNLLVRYSALMQLKGPFDETMGLVGCDDNALGISLHKLGCKFVYTNEAITYEFVPKSRTNFKWLMQRAYRSANTFWLLTQDKNIFKLLKLLAGALARIIIGFVLLLPTLLISPIVGKHHFVRAIMLMVRGYAIIAGIFGKNYEEYRHAYTIPTTANS